MSVANYYVNETTKSSLLACRGCLATDVRLYNIKGMCQYRLLDAYSALLSTAVQVTDDLPHYFCSYCAALLLKCDSFRIKCIDSLIVLRNAQQQYLNVTTEHVKKINRSTNFKRSELEAINICSKNPKNKKIYSDISTDTDLSSDPDISSDTETSSDSDISSDSNELTDIDSTEKESDFSMSEDERKLNLKAKKFIEHDIKIDYNDASNANNEIRKLLKKYLGINGQTSDLLKDFEDSIDCAKSKETASNIRNLRMKQISEIINHIQYSSGTSIKLLKRLDEDALLCENKDPKSVTETTQKNKVIKQESESNEKVKILNKQKVARKDKVLQKTTHSKTALESKSNHKPDNVNNEGSNSDISPLIQIEKVKIEISLEEPKYNEMSITLDPEDDIAIANLKTKFKPKCKKGSNTPKKGAPKACNKIINGRQTKNVKFSEELYAMYNTEVKYLSKEEQIKEINGRKECDSYKNGPFKCNFCFKGFVIEETFKNHMLLHDNISGNFVCDICKCHFMNKKRLIRHKQGHNKIFTCKECGHISRHGSLAAQHYRWHGGKKFSCKDCGKEFQNKSSQYGHIKMCHPTSEQLVRCEICGDSFNGTAGLQRHDNKTHKEMYSPECYCSGCNTQFYCSDAFKAHQGADGLCITTHKYCVRCGMSFETEQLLNEHEIEQRKPQNQFKCDVCYKTFKFFGKLKRHQWRHSTTYPKNIKLVRMYEKKEKGGNERDGDCNKERICEVCGKLMRDAGRLKNHYNMVHSADKPFKCTICSKAFKLSAFLVAHMRVHTGERPYQCQNCPKAFQNKQNLKRHNIVHTGERPHSCNVCGKTFQTSSYVKEHIQTVHMKIPMPPRIRRRNKKTE